MSEMEIRGFLPPETQAETETGAAGRRLATAEEVRQAILAIRPDLRVEAVEADGDQLVTASGGTGAVTFSTAAYPQLRPDGTGPYYRGWAWRADTAAAATRPLEEAEHWRALVFWPDDVASALATTAEPR